MKIDFIADTNFAIYVHEGNKINKTEETKLRQLISDCFVIGWNLRIKDQTINLKH